MQKMNKDNNLITNISNDEAKVILAMRRYGPFATFRVEKRPTKENPNGELLKVTTEIRQVMRSIQFDYP